MTRLFYAWIEVDEFGQPAREQRIGPYAPEDPEASLEDQVETLREKLVRRGENVNRIELA